MKDFSMTVCIGAIPLKSVNYYMSNIKSRVTVKIDKNSEFISSPDDKESTFDVFAPVGSEEKCTALPMKASSTISATSVPYLTMRATVEQVFESSSQAFCKECGRVREKHQFKNEITLQTGCKSDKCISDLQVESYVADQERGPYVIGSTKKLVLGVIVSNQAGEPAYAPNVLIKYPKSLQLVKSVHNCEQSEAEDYGRLSCRLPGPILESKEQK